MLYVGVGVGNALVVGITVWRDTIGKGDAYCPLVQNRSTGTMEKFNGSSVWTIEGENAVLTLKVRIPLARVNNCLQGKQLKAAEKVTDAAKAFTNACYTSARCIIEPLAGTEQTSQEQVFSAQLQVFSAGAPLANAGAGAVAISASEYAKLQTAGASRV